VVKLGKISKGEKCSVKGCVKEAIRSLPIDDVTAAGIEVHGTRRVYLCRDHYKQYKKSAKKEQMVDKWRYGGRIKKFDSSFSTYVKTGA
jgi:hypothetical protein